MLLFKNSSYVFRYFIKNDYSRWDTFALIPSKHRENGLLKRICNSFHHIKGREEEKQQRQRH